MFDWIRQNVLESQFGFSILLMLGLVGIILGCVAYAVLLERKVSAWTQDRYGPNRVGPWGLLQPVADGIKAFLKEDIIPRNVDRILFILAPWFIFLVAIIGFAVIPWGGTFRWPWMGEEDGTITAQVASIDIGLLYIVAVGSLGVYGIVLGGWASNNKYSFYGGMRAAAQMLSYEVPMGLAILVAILTTGHLRLEGMVEQQGASVGPVVGAAWTVLYHPLAALILFITALAEANRTPFDLAECEQELVGGYHTEYSAMKLALFFMAEYTHLIIGSAFIVSMFFGGYLMPGCPWINESQSVWAMLARIGVFGGKVFLIIFMYMVVRWTLPRFRFDQLMRLSWKSLVPVCMLLVVLQGVIVFVGCSQWWSLAGNVAILVCVILFGAVRNAPVTGRQHSLVQAES